MVGKLSEKGQIITVFDSAAIRSLLPLSLAMVCDSRQAVQK